MKFHQSLQAFVADKCRADGRAHIRHVRALVDARDVAALASNEHFPVACKVLLGRLPRAGGLSNVGQSPVGILYSADGAALVSLPLRLSQSFGVIKPDASASSLSQTYRRIRDAKGPAADTVRALLTGRGEPASALLLRRVIEARRGLPIPIFVIEGEA